MIQSITILDGHVNGATAQLVGEVECPPFYQLLHLRACYCRCSISHGDVAMQVDRRTSVIVWCATGPPGLHQERSKLPRRRRIRGGHHPRSLRDQERHALLRPTVYVHVAVATQRSA